MSSEFASTDMLSGGGERGALDGAMRVSPGGVESVADETDVPLGAGGTV